MKGLVLVQEVLVQRENGPIISSNNRRYKSISTTVDGQPIYLEEGYLLQTQYITKKEADKLTKNL